MDKSRFMAHGSDATGGSRPLPAGETATRRMPISGLIAACGLRALAQQPRAREPDHRSDARLAEGLQRHSNLAVLESLYQIRCNISRAEKEFSPRQSPLLALAITCSKQSPDWVGTSCANLSMFPPSKALPVQVQVS